MAPISDDELKALLQQEGLQVWVCSFGGCGSNMLLDHLEQYGYTVRGETYKERGIHFPHPVEIPNVKAIYMYGDFFNAIVSQHYRNVLSLNLSKASNYEAKDYSYNEDFSNLDVTPFINQYLAWTKCNKLQTMDILHLQYEKIWEHWATVQAFLNKSLPPPPKRDRATYQITYNQVDNLHRISRHFFEKTQVAKSK